MSKVIYSDCNILIEERNTHILINPNGERFYFVPCYNQGDIYTNATLSLMDNGSYEIEGTQILYTTHKDRSFSYEKLLCLHPQELIKKRSFLGLIHWYRVNGVMKREMRSRYVCMYKEYRIEQRLELLSNTFVSEV